jgi:hypothetical protein
MSSLFIIIGLISAFVLGYSFGFVTASAAGMVAALDRERAHDEQEGEEA